MKAAVFRKDELPKYVEDFAAPKVQNENELLISVKASALKNIDRTRATGQHYSAQHEEWTVKAIGGDGVGLLADGTRVYGVGVSGMVAEKRSLKRTE